MGSLHVITEVGNFASLNIKDPTIQSVEMEDADLNEVVKKILDEDDEKSEDKDA